MTARGLKNHNPGNLVHVETNKWQGLATPPSDGRFCVFTAAPWGIRAMALNLIAYQDRHDLRTIRGLIGRYAPWSENNVDAYVASVASQMRRAPDEALDLHVWADLRPLVVAMIRHENGTQPYGDAVIDEGLRRAGVVPAVAPPVRREAGVAPASVATASTVGAGAVEAIAEATQAVQSLSPYLDVAKYLLLALALAGLGLTLWRLWQKHRAVVS